MNSLVGVAYVPDTETRIKIGADGKSIDESDVKWIVSPYDEYALEEALRTKETKGAGNGDRHLRRPGTDEDGAARMPGARRGRRDLGGLRPGLDLDALGTAKALAAVAKGSGVRLLLVRPEGRRARRVARRPDVGAS